LVRSALVEALRDGEIAHAGLDVTDPEPLPRDHLLATHYDHVMHAADSSHWYCNIFYWNKQTKA